MTRGNFTGESRRVPGVAVETLGRDAAVHGRPAVGQGRQARGTTGKGAAAAAKYALANASGAGGRSQAGAER